ncbi:hypothetical protein IFR05_004029 [Cadophora sp. M221]|nr:hypothetical protein IFR05_004029 [Cadophora sp. M221]
MSYRTWIEVEAREESAINPVCNSISLNLTPVYNFQGDRNVLVPDIDADPNRF